MRQLDIQADWHSQTQEIGTFDASRIVYEGEMQRVFTQAETLHLNSPRSPAPLYLRQMGHLPIHHDHHHRPSLQLFCAMLLRALTPPPPLPLVHMGAAQTKRHKNPMNE